MKKQFKYLAAAGLVAALLLAAGCGDDAKDKKPAPELEKKVENVVVKPQGTGSEGSGAPGGEEGGECCSKTSGRKILQISQLH